MIKAKESANCPYCLSPIADAEEKVRCPKCGVAHHADCWRANGKCSIYGCDGWALWSDGITDKLAPSPAKTADLTNPSDEKPPAPEMGLCIKCGAPARPGRMLCWNCSRKKRRFLENCSGPALLFFGGITAIIALIVRALT